MVYSLIRVVLVGLEKYTKQIFGSTATHCGQFVYCTSYFLPTVYKESGEKFDVLHRAAYYGQIEIIKFLEDEYRKNLTFKKLSCLGYAIFFFFV